MGEKLSGAVVFILVLLVSALGASAEMFCEHNLRAHYRGSDIIFVGTARESNLGKILGSRAVRTTFDTTKIIRASLQSVSKEDGAVSVWLVEESTECCHYSFEQGTQYLVFAGVDPESGLLATNQCGVFRAAEAKGMLSAMKWRGWFWRRF